MGNTQGNTTPQEEEILVKCEIRDVVKEFFKDSIVIWHDPNIDSPANKPFIDQLENLCQVKTFTQFEEALIFLQETKKTCHVIISSEAQIKEICSAPNVYGVYILGKVQEKERPKTLHSEANIYNLLFKVEQNLMKNYEEKASLMFAFAPIFNETDKKKLKNLHLYLNVIPAFKDRSQAKNDLLALCKALYSDEKNFDFIINLAQNYEQQNVLNWYIQQSLFPKVINKCLAISSSDSLQYCRLPLYDMQRNIREDYQRKSKDFSGVLYKAAYLTPEEWMKLKENTTKEIETLGFFSTFKDRNIALNSIQTDPHKKVLITILLPMGLNEEEYGFADLQFKNQPHQVIFNTMSRFSILQANEQYFQDLQCRHLVLLYGTQGFRKYLTEHNPIQKVSTGNPRLISCDFCKGRVLQKSLKFFFKSFINETHYCQDCFNGIPSTDKIPFFCIPISNTAPIVIRGCPLAFPPNLKIPFYGYKCCSCEENHNSTSYFKCAECYQKWCPDCIENATESCMRKGHAIILERNPYSFWQERMPTTELKELQAEKENMPKESDPSKQIDMFQETGEYEKIRDYFIQLVQILEQTNHSNSERVGHAYWVIADTSSKLSEHEKTILYALKADKIFQFIGYQNTYRYSKPVLGTMAESYRHLKEYSKSEECFLKCIEISKLADENDLHSQGFYYGRLGDLYKDQKNYQKAVECYVKTCELFKRDVQSLRFCHMRLIKFSLALGDYKKAEEDCFEWLRIIESNLKQLQDELPNCYYFLGKIYRAQRSYKKAEKYSLQALDIAQSNPRKQYSLAEVYAILADIYQEQGNYKKALEYRLKENEDSEEGDPAKPKHENSLGSIYQRQGQYDKALELHSKALERQRLIYAEDSIHLVRTYFLLAQVYYHKGEYSKALEYCFKTIEISKKEHGEDYHLSCGAKYWLLGKLYEKKGEHNQALEYYFKGQESLKSMEKEKNQYLGSCYCEIGNVYNSLGENEKALEYQFRALHVTEKAFEDINKNHPDMAEVFSGLGRVYCSKKDYKVATGYHQKSLDIRIEVHGEQHPDVAVCYVDMGDVCKGEGDDEKAKKYYLKAIEIRKSMLGKGHPETISLQEILTSIAKSKEDPGEEERENQKEENQQKNQEVEGHIEENQKADQQ